MKIAGVDYSICSPAICKTDGYGGFEFHGFKRTKKCNSTSDKIFLHTYPDYGSQEERFYKLAKWAFEIVKDCDFVNIEGYAMGAKGQTFTIGEATGLLKHLLWKAGIHYNIIPPSTIKKFASGKGNSDKNEMAEAFIAKEKVFDIFGAFGISYEKDKKPNSPITDMIDSYWLYNWTK